MRCARPVIDQLVVQLAGAPVCVALTDDRARLLLRRDTTSGIGRHADGNCFAAGFGYAEGSVGTNGVGTVLESGSSVHVVGGEHFVERLRAYACAGAPVRDPVTGRIEAVLDLSCRVEHYSPVLHSLVTAAAARVQDALLRDRDTGQQAVFDHFTRVEARSQRAVLAVGHRVVLANTALQTLLDPGDLAVLQEHARSRMGRSRGPDVDDRVELPSGAQVRLRGTTVAAGSAVAGVVAVVGLEREVAAPRLGTGLPPPPCDGTPAWSAAWRTAAAALRSRTPVLVLGEQASGRARLLTEVDRALHGPGHVVEVGPGAALPQTSDLVVLRDVDRWTAVPSVSTVRRPAATAVTAADLTARLGGTWCTVTVPPLRERSRDVAALAVDVLAEVAPGHDVRLSPAAQRTLARHDWPGNVAELRDTLAAAVRRRPTGVLDVADLPASCQSAPRSVLRPVDRAERDTIVEALRDSGGNRSAAASVLGVARSTLYRKIAQYGITA